MKNYNALLRLFVLILISIAICSCDSKKSESIVLKVAINQGPEGDAINTLAPEYEKAKIEIIKLPYQSLREQLIIKLRDGNSDFDVIMLDDPWFPEMATKLSPLKNVPKDLIDDIVPASLHLSRYPYAKGELRALPFVGNTQLLFYRKDILDSIGISPIPENWEGLAKLTLDIVSKQIKFNGNKVYGYAIRGRSGAPIVTDFLPIYWSMGGRLVDDRGTPTKEAVDKDKLMNALIVYKDLFDSSPPGANNFDWSEMTSSFTNGQSVFQLNWPAAISIIDSEIKSKSSEGAWGVAITPGSPGVTGTSMIGNWLIAIPADSKRTNEAEAFILWLMEQQGRVAGSGNPPTRISVFNQLSSNPDSDYYNTIRKALEQSTPRARSNKWSIIEDVVSRSVSKFLTADISAKEAVEGISTGINKALSAE